MRQTPAFRQSPIFASASYRQTPHGGSGWHRGGEAMYKTLGHNTHLK